jgi:hypothetical protein
MGGKFPETCRIVVLINLEFSASVGFIHNEFVTMHGRMILKFRHEVCLTPTSNKVIGTHTENCSILRYKTTLFCRSSQGFARICCLDPDSFTEFILFTGRLSETENCFLTEFQELCRSKDITRTFLAASDRHVVVSVRADTAI